MKIAYKNRHCCDCVSITAVSCTNQYDCYVKVLLCQVDSTGVYIAISQSAGGLESITERKKKTDQRTGKRGKTLIIFDLLMLQEGGKL